MFLEDEGGDAFADGMLEELDDIANMLDNLSDELEDI